jgi:hypothetical protein
VIRFGPSRVDYVNLLGKPVLKPLIATLSIVLSAAPAVAFERIVDPSRFTTLIQDNSLSRFGITLQVMPDGRISGRGFGQPVSGEWRWQDGLFCRTLAWGGSDLGYNCQAVLLNGDTVRFVADAGQGDFADFRLR